MKIPAARQAQTAFNQFLFETSLLAGELDTLHQIDDPVQRSFALRGAQQAYQELLSRCDSVHVPAGDAPLIQNLLERIRSRLKALD